MWLISYADVLRHPIPMSWNTTVGWGYMTVAILGGSAVFPWQCRTVTTSMKVAAWNVNHRPKRTAIPLAFGEALKLLECTFSV